MSSTKTARTKVGISESDYDELKSSNGRWTIDEYAYWVAKFKSGYPTEGYGQWGVRLEEDGMQHFISWEHYMSCD